MEFLKIRSLQQTKSGSTQELTLQTAEAVIVVSEQEVTAAAVSAQSTTVISSPDGQPEGVKSRHFSFRFWSKKPATDSPRPAKMSRSQKQARSCALAVRSLIVGPSTLVAPKTTKATAKPQLGKIKTQLLKPKSANKVIAHLRQLPAADDHDHSKCAQGPIHAVCLPFTEAEEDSRYFNRLSAGDGQSPNVLSAPVDTLEAMFKEMKIIDLVSSPDLGLGQPVGGKGLLTGALPTPGTVINGVKRITPELMALGFATGQGLAPDHSGVYPPTDRMSVLTYWWGLELLLPPPSIVYLSEAHSIATTIINFLTAFSLVNNGVKEILPFVRYISQYIDYEFNSIKKHDKGQGVVCAATWIMPAAMIPRPWDFPVPPQEGNEKAPLASPGLKLPDFPLNVAPPQL